MPILEVMVVAAACLCAVTWIIALYYLYQCNRRFKAVSKGLFNSSERLSPRMRYKTVLANDARYRELTRKSNLSSWVFFASLIIATMLVGYIFWIE